MCCGHRFQVLCYNHDALKGRKSEQRQEEGRKRDEQKRGRGKISFLRKPGISIKY